MGQFLRTCAEYVAASRPDLLSRPALAVFLKDMAWRHLKRTGFAEKDAAPALVRMILDEFCCD